MKIFQNQHRHSMNTNARVPDSVTTNEAYAKRAKELGHGIISTMEHGWQGRYIEGYELAQKYNLKFLFGTEAYWVKDRLEKDKTNSHICIFAKTENARQCINDILAEANISGFYFRPRLDLDLIFSLPKDEVIITTACVAFWKYDDIDKTVLDLNNHFKDFYLEVQYHNTDSQKELNKHIISLADNYNIPIIMGCDSHYISQDKAWERDDYLASKKIFYDNEQGWYLDYPDGDTAYQRFIDQGILSEKQIDEAFDNTNIFLSVSEYDSPIFNKEIKMITVYPELTQKERDKKYLNLIKGKWNEEKNKIPIELHNLYKKEITKEAKDVITTKHSDYFLYDYRLVDRAVKNGGMITNSGRGSAVSYYTNKLLGFTKIDRISAKVKMYPERFISPTRILQSKSLADLDMNLGNPEVFAETQTEILVEVYGDVGKEFSYPMLAYGKFHAKSAFKMYARAKNLDFETANQVSQQIEAYEKALKYAEDDEKDDINIYDYVDEKYHKLIKDSEEYLGIISDVKTHPCGYLLYNRNIRREIGLIKIKTESTKKETLCTIMDGKWAEDYKFLKNDLLKVDVVKLIKLAYKRLNLQEHEEKELIEICKDNHKVWDIYKNGYTMGINQVEKSATKHKAMKYQPKNISELCAFVAAIRPGFKSMYNTFEKREPFSYDIPAFDNLIQTDEMKSSFLLYQEMAMAALSFAGIPMSECYDIIKHISKKREEKIKAYKDMFLNGFAKKIQELENRPEKESQQIANKVWQIISDSCRYQFNASHAYCVAMDSLYGAYLKSNYPLHFYEVFLNLLFQKGNQKDRIALVKKEATKAFNIKFEPIRFRQDNRQFTLDEKNNAIYTALSSIKDMGKKNADELYQFKDKQYNNFLELLIDIKEKTSINVGQIDILVKLNFFEEFGKNYKLLNFIELYNKYYNRKQISKNKLEQKYNNIILKYSRETNKTYVGLQSIDFLNYIWNTLEDKSLSMRDQIQAEHTLLGYIETMIPNLDDSYVYIIDVNTKYTPRMKGYKFKDGQEITFKIYKNSFETEPLIIGDIIKIYETKEKYKSIPIEGKWIPTKELETIVLKYSKISKE